MNFTPADVDGVWLVDPEPIRDARGWFARVWCRDEFARRGLPMQIVQASAVFSPAQGTLRGLHYQAAPHEEIKLLRCVRGAAQVVVADIRPASPTHKRWTAVELSAANGRWLYVPAGVAQGYQTLVDDTELFYQMSHDYHPDSARGVRFDDPAFAIAWPLPISIISDRDRSWPDHA